MAMDNKSASFPRILLRSPTVDGELYKISAALNPDNGVTSAETETADNCDDIFHDDTEEFPGKSSHLSPTFPPFFSLSSSPSLLSNEASPTPSRAAATHQRSISLVDPYATPMVPMVDTKDDARRPRGMSLPFGPTSTLQDQPTSSRRRGMSFLHLNEGGFSSFFHQLQHLPVPTLTISTPGGDLGGRKFSFGLRRLSQTTLNRSDSMISLSFRSLANFVNEDNLLGLKNYLDLKRSQVDDRDENNSTALIFASSQGKLPFVRELIRYGGDVNAEDADNWSALLCAAKEGHLAVCRELLEHGSIVDHRDMGSWTPLLWAAYKGRTDIVSLLLEKKADVNAHENYHLSPLHWACGRGHVDIAKLLISRGAKVNVGDKYGTTPLIWACRKGILEVVEILLKAGAHVDASGMNSWTPLLVATSGDHVDVVNLLLEHKPNVNALDKDGYTALAIACKEGHNEIAQALLLAPGIYVSQQHRSGDTNLILAVKGGHRGIVEALIKKYVDIDTAGKDRKTALYSAVEKNNPGIVKILLGSNPDLEVTTKDGDTALLRAVRNRNAEIVQLLVDKKAKVSVTDKKGDTALHIAMRARSKTIVEILLRNPKNSQLLYRPNRNGETPYNIDVNHQKTILSQVFGHLITNEENENMLGYDLYSSALADILSEPTLSMPITVGLFAKWGSGKSFLLRKLKEEMKNFSRKWVDPSLRISLLLVTVIVHVAVPLGVALGVVTSWLTGLILGGCVILLAFTFLLILWACNKRYDWNWPYQASANLAKTLNSFKLVLKVMFCNPPGSQMDIETTRTQPIQFFFTEQARISNTTGGEHYVSVLLGSLYDSIEADYGWLSTRLYRAFRPTAQKPTSSWRWRKACCMPYVVIFELWLLLSMVEIVLLAIFLQEYQTPITRDDITDSNIHNSLHLDKETLQILLIVLGAFLSVAILANIYTISHLATSLVFSQRRHLQRTISRLEVIKSEGFLSALKKEVSLMTEMVRCLDAMTCQQSRLVVVVDGLDSCEQDKVLMVLDAIHLLSDVNSPFIIVLAIDPHIIAKAVERNTRRLITETNINGLEYLRNMVHLPFFLANSALRRVKVAQTASRRSTLAPNDGLDEPSGPQLSVRRISVDSSFAASTEKLKPPTRKGSRKLKMSESVASSIGSNLNKICGAQDLTKMLLTDDYFSDVNPRSMRRLLNVIYVTGRLLKAFQMEFNWYRLALWANITEQWPYRCSWIIFHYEMNEDRWDDQTPLKIIYDEIRHKITAFKEIEPLLEVDRDEKKFEVFLSYHRSTLVLSDLKVFLPFAINLDPYFKKVIKEDLQEEDWDAGTTFQPRASLSTPKSPWGPMKPPESGLQRRSRRFSPSNSTPVPPVTMWTDQGWFQFAPQQPVQTVPYHQPFATTSSIPNDLLESGLSSKTVAEVCELITRTSEIKPDSAAKYTELIRLNNISGKVLVHCDLNELKNVLQMAFGDWELFKLLVVSLREHELTSVTQTDEGQKNVRFTERRRTTEKKRCDSDKERRSNVPTAMENQVTLEDEMICGALTTLSEEACEDAIEGGCVDLDTKDTSVVYLQSSPLSQTTWQVADDSSAPSSVAGTPILKRRQSRRNSRSRPSSLIVEQMSPLKPTHTDKPKSLKITEAPTIVTPNLIVTPAGSIEQLQRCKDKFQRLSGEHVRDSLSDDESTPLVLESQQTPSCEISPMSGVSMINSAHSSSSEASVGNILDHCKSCDSIASDRSKFGSNDIDCVHDIGMHLRSRHIASPPLLRQHEFAHDCNEVMEWDGPETSV